jgi:Polyketide cyclase / dehydrase and lipid transport
MIEIEHTAHSPADRASVWNLLSDLGTWHKWGPWTQTTYDGEIRTMVAERKKLTGKPYVMKERVTALVPMERFEYDLLSGLPVRDYHGTVTLRDADGGGTDIHWASAFKPPWPIFGGLWHGAMLKVITDVSERAAEEAARRATLK